MTGAAETSTDALSDEAEGGEKPSSVLFLCNHNVIRSPMAEGLLKNLAGTSIYVDSAGVTKGDVDTFVTATMAELGINMAGHRPKTLEDLDDSWFDLIITFSPKAHHVALDMDVVEAGSVLYWPAADPTVAEGSRDILMASYRDVRNHIKTRIEQYFSPMLETG